MTYQNYPLILVGTTDLNKEFHPFGIMLTKLEKSRDYAFMFACVKDLAKKILAYEYNPRILVADSAKSITKGFKKVFMLNKRIDCWAHVDRNIDKNINKHVYIFSLLFSSIFFFIYF